ncbi:MAG: hypothetical protein FWG40_04965 [Peptococcaceae bacterium]|nr:hypothetical protein [Peptococcaceae bacterium]
MVSWRLIIFMGLLAVTATLSGCVNQPPGYNADQPDSASAPSSPYGAFVQKIQSENLVEYGCCTVPQEFCIMIYGEERFEWMIQAYS